MDKERFIKIYKQLQTEENMRRLVVSVTAIFIVFIFVLAGICHDKSEAWTKDGFKVIAAHEIEKIRVVDGNKETYNCQYQVGDHYVRAVFTDQSPYDYVNAYIDSYADYLTVKMMTEGKQNKVHDLIMSAVTTESGRGTVSLVITYETGIYEDGKMHIDGQGIRSYTFDKHTGKTIVWQQLFKSAYEKKVASYFSNRDDLDCYAVNRNSITYLFVNEDEKTGIGKIEAVNVPEKTCSTWLRKWVMDRWIDPNKPMIALTYDDGPGDSSEDKIHAVLEKYDAVATFFYSGYRIKGREDKLQKSVELGCEIGSHTWDHCVLTHCNSKQLTKQLDKTNEAIKAACGQYPTVFRPSYGATNSKVNKRADLPVIIWDIDTLDWESRNAKKVYKSVVKKKHLDGKIVLMHCIYGSTADATAKLVPWLEEHGYQLVTVSELIKYRYGETPQNCKVYSGWY